MTSDLPPDFYIDLKQYRKVHLIEKNAFSVSYLVENNVTKKLYFSVESKTKDLFIPSEIENLVKLHYPSYYTPVGYSQTNFENQDFPIVLFDYMQNGTLGLLFSNMDFDLSRDTRTYIILLGTALAMRNITDDESSYLNLTPDNIFLDDNCFPLLLFFGKSLISDDDYVNAIHIQNPKLPLYVAPEILANKTYDFKADSYSFAIIAYQIITGVAPYNKLLNKSVEEFKEKVINGYRPNISMITSECIRSFFNLCWSSDPNERPSFDTIVEMITEYSFYKVFDIDSKEVIRYLNLFGNRCNIQISIFQKNDPDIDQDEIEYLKRETKRSEEEIWHAYEEIQNNPIDFSDSSKSFDEIVTIMMSLNGRKRRTIEIYVYFTKKKQFDLNDELDNIDYSAPAFGSRSQEDEEEDYSKKEPNNYGESIQF